MNPKNRSILLFILLISMLWMPATPAVAATATQPAKNEGLSPQGFLNPDGTLNLSSMPSGALDLDGWNVSMDPSRGPVFAKQVAKSSLNTVIPGDWSSVGDTPSNFSKVIETITVSGTDVYVGGYFTDAAGLAEADYVAKWDGTSWSALGDNGSGDGALSGAAVYALAVDGTNVYIAGYFNDVAGVAEADYVAKWDGTNWSALGNNGSGDGALNSSVWALTVSGTDVYVGGNFSNAAGIPEADNVAKWDGTNWSALGDNGSGNGALNSSVYALAVSGTDVFVGGEFTNATGVPEADYVAKWDGTSWSALGDNGSGDGALNSYSAAFVVSGTDVYVSGNFTNAAGVAQADYVAKWDGTNWSGLGNNGSGNGALNNEVEDLALCGTDVYVSGYFTDAAGVPEADYVAKWDGTNWSALGNNGSGNGALNSYVYALAVSGTDVYTGGLFTDAAGLAEADYAAKWNGTNWSAWGNNGLGNNALNGTVQAIVVSGTDVYVGGGFSNAAGIPEADYVAKWDGTNWSALGDNGSGDGALNANAYALAVSGTDVYVGGGFSNVAGVPEADYVAKWDGISWSALGNNGSGNGAFNTTAKALAVSGTDVYVGGGFSNAAGVLEADYVAKWDGTNWSALGNNGSGDGAFNTTVNALAVSGTDVYVGGGFSNVAGVPEADYVAKWDGTNWSALGDNGSGNGAFNTTVNALAVSSTDVYVGGHFIDVAGVPEADYVAKWDGTNWSALGNNGSGDGALNSRVNALTVFGTDLFVGGQFINAAGVPEADYMAKWDGTDWSALGDNGSGNGTFNNDIYALAISSSALMYTGGAFTNINNGGTVLLKADYLAADNIAPVVHSVVRDDPSPTSQQVVSYTVTFSEAVTGVDAADFDIFRTGFAGALPTVIDFYNFDNVHYQVTVDTGSGSGTLRLDVLDDDSIVNNANEPLGGAGTANGSFSSGEVYTVQKPPLVVSLNGGFNIYVGTSKIPKSWKAVKFTTSDGKTTTVKKEGSASVHISGTASVTKTLSQTLMLNGGVGDPLTFTYWVKGSSIPKTGTCTGQVLLYNAGVLVGIKSLNCPKGTYNFRKMSVSYAASNAFDKAVIKFTFKSSGQVWFDAVTLAR